MRFSIVTPTFRSGSWLQLCVASVADQAVELEHLIQDGGSDDHSLDRLSSRDHLKIVIEKDHGMYDALNRGLRRAQGDLVGHLNADEQYLPGALSAVAGFLEAHPEVDVVLGNAVVVDPEGNYLWHRKILPPKLGHTWTCPLSILTCSTFFRRRLLEQGPLFDPRWQIYGDSAWVLELLKRNVPMAALGTFTSAFTHTGQNLSLDPRAATEAQDFFATAPWHLRKMRPLILLHHRLRRWWGGVYHQTPFDYSIYALASPKQRVSHHVSKPTFRWRW